MFFVKKKPPKGGFSQAVFLVYGAIFGVSVVSDNYNVKIDTFYFMRCNHFCNLFIELFV